MQGRQSLSKFESGLLPIFFATFILHLICLKMFLYMCRYPTYLSVIVCVLMGLQGVKVLTSKRIEFFREASSGYNTNAYFLAVNLISTIELSGVIILAALTSAFLRAPVASWWSYIVHFLVLTWVSLSWG